MKTLLLSSLLFINSSCNSQNTAEASRQTVVDQIPKSSLTKTTEGVSYHDGSDHSSKLLKKETDSIFNTIQTRVSQATNEAFMHNNTSSLDKLETELNDANLTNENLRNYWIAYVNYYKTIVGLKTENEKLCKQANEKGVKALEKNKVKTSEDYALLALLKGLSYSFSSGMKAPIISKQVNNYIKKGLEADSTNFRVHYAQASVDFYTPKQYGGGKKTEKHLLKAVELPEKNSDNPQLPNWGREEVYDLLIRYYLRENQKDSAQKYFNEAKKLLPNSYVVSSHQHRFQD